MPVLISRAPNFFRGTPAPNHQSRDEHVTTARMTSRMNQSPPPGAASPSPMLRIVIPPPNGVYESCIEFTEPVEVSVVLAPGNGHPGYRSGPLCLRLHRPPAGCTGMAFSAATVSETGLPQNRHRRGDRKPTKHLSTIRPNVRRG